MPTTRTIHHVQNHKNNPWFFFMQIPCMWSPPRAGRQGEKWQSGGVSRLHLLPKNPATFMVYLFGWVLMGLLKWDNFKMVINVRELLASVVLLVVSEALSPVAIYNMATDPIANWVWSQQNAGVVQPLRDHGQQTGMGCNKHFNYLTITTTCFEK